MTEQFTELIRAKLPGFNPGSVFEIGSQHCQQAVELSAHFPEAQVYAFEPNPELAPDCGGLAARRHNVHFIPLAVSLVNGVVPFHQSASRRNKGYSSLYRPSGRYDHIEPMPCRTLEVLSTRLDTFIVNYNVPPPEVIWIDVQGAEVAALKSLGQYLKHVRAIWSEVSYQPMYVGQALHQDLKLWLRSEGFDMVHENYISADPITAKPWQGDVCFIRL